MIKAGRGMQLNITTLIFFLTPYLIAGLGERQILSARATAPNWTALGHHIFAVSPFSLLRALVVHLTV